MVRIQFPPAVSQANFRVHKRSPICGAVHQLGRWPVQGLDSDQQVMRRSCGRGARTQAQAADWLRSLQSITDRWRLGGTRQSRTGVSAPYRRASWAGSASCVVLVRLGIAEINQHSIAHILGDKTAKAADGVGHDIGGRRRPH